MGTMMTEVRLVKGNNNAKGRVEWIYMGERRRGSIMCILSNLAMKMRGKVADR